MYGSCEMRLLMLGGTQIFKSVHCHVLSEKLTHTSPSFHVYYCLVPSCIKAVDKMDDIN